MPVIPPPNNPIYYISLSGKQIITDALSLLGALDVSEDPEDAILTRDMRTLNMMLDSWNTEKLVTYAMTQFSAPLVPNQQSYVIGENADFNTTLRPPKIEDGEAWLRVNNIDFPLKSDTVEEWAAIPMKSLAGQPREIQYGPDTITGTIMFYPIPDQAYTFLLWQRTLLSQIVDPNQVFYLPPGYAEAITNHLAIRIAPKVGKAVPAEVVEVATNAKASIKRLNMQPETLESDVAIQARRGYYDIRSGGWF